jgi:hypothetical protein
LFLWDVCFKRTQLLASILEHFFSAFPRALSQVVIRQDSLRQQRILIDRIWPCLALARNPALTSLGIACAIGIFWSLVATIFFTLPAMAAAEPKPSASASVDSNL